MNPDRWRQVEQLYQSSLERQPRLRADLLSDACKDDQGLRGEVESLLAESEASQRVPTSVCETTAPLSEAPAERLAAGSRLGPYRIETALGTGGMGEVYQAVDTRLGRKVAIKISQERFSAGFEREARTISALNHPHICTLYDVGALPSGAGYMVTELIQGETLRDWLKHAPPVERIFEIARQMLEALHAAHEAGIVHRDLKPANIMVRFDGYVKVLDFGIAKRISASRVLQTETTASAELSLPGQITGTVAYMSPEQILGKEVDQRSDLFAFGIVLYEMVAGQHPWPRGSHVDTMHAILHDSPPPINATSPLAAQLAGVVRNLLNKSPAARYPVAAAVLEALASRAAPQSEARLAPLTSIVVLPFVFLSEIAERKALSLGFADALITMLASLEDITVLPTSAILNYADGTDPGGVCRDLGVRHALQGNVQRLGAQWRVSMQLFDAATQRITLSEKLDFALENVFELQDEIGRRVMTSLQSRFPLNVPKSRERYSSDAEAFEEFMTGLRESYSNQPETLRSAVQHLSTAVELDPEFALAHATLSYVSLNMHFEFDPRHTWLEKAEHHCRQALTLDPALPEGHFARAWILWSPAKNFQHAEAIAALEQVLAAQPNNERAHNRMATICLHIGRLQEARIAHEQARRSNPKTRSTNLEDFYLLSGDFARLEEAAEAHIRETPVTMYALHLHSQAALYRGDLEVAEQQLTAALHKLPDEPMIVSLQGMLHARRNQTDLALQCVRKALDAPDSFGHTHHTHHQIACVYAVLRDTDKAMAWLERSADTGFPCWPFFKLNPYLENLRPEPRFQRFVAELEHKYASLKIQRL